ncbi:MAG: LysR family transcriptional regulator [Bacteroidetes bacterium]|nr:MAG: LysR family transcriptional regulator [Bacteroidota bacterium]REK05691.1 MAG: LysR family transcriptional regulator [Bacteroidota bacterium]REK32003.1 MAG: LysR family transcriptional regulator [Bacteroidota bacterium]REK50067.1 MAG: LysR family transcriptional regulator [Bacteroidota bacterium]
MNYTLNQLQVFLKVTQTGSITKAAEELHLTQPAVSIQLKNFQNQFNMPLTEVVGRKLFITGFGKEIATAAERILNEAQKINLRTTEQKGQIAGRLKISVVSTGKYVMPFFLSSFLQKHEGVELAMDVTNRSMVLESLEKNEVDFSLVSVLPGNLRLEKIDLMENKLFLVGNTRKPFRQKQYSKSVFEELPLIYRENGSGTRLTMEKYIRENKIAVKKKLELKGNEAVKQAVIAGLGYSIMPLIGIKAELMQSELQIIPVKGLPIKTMWNLVWLKNKNFGPAALAFLDYLKREKEKIIRSRFSYLDWK